MKFVLLLLAFGCAHNYQPATVETKEPEVIVTDPGTLPVETEKPVVVLDKEPLKKEVFTTTSSLAYMSEVARVSNCIVNNQDFLKEVESYPKFTYTDKTPKQVADSLRNAKPVVLSTYRTKNPWSSVIATTWSDDPTVYFNTRRNPRDMPSMVNTSCHEGLGHIQGYGHGDNYYTKDKDSSVPWALGTICEKYAEKCK